ncbi:MAG: hypothetical protein QXF46_06290 [Thermofilaceae archaeon]
MKLTIPLLEAGLDEGNFYAGLASGFHRSPDRRGRLAANPYDYASHAISQEHHSDQTAAPAKL